MNKKKLDLVKKSKTKVWLGKSGIVSTLYDMCINIDNFYFKVKNNNDISDEDKAQMINNFNKLLLQINDNFVRLSEKVGVEYDEPLAIKTLKNRYS